MFEVKMTEMQVVVVHMLLNAGLSTDASDFFTEEEIKSAHDFIKTIEEFDIDFEI